MPAAGIAFTAALALARVAGAAELEVRLLYVGDAGASPFRGAEQGLDEANVQGRFLGQRYTLAPSDGRDPGAAAQVTAIIAAVSPARLGPLAAAHADVPVLNVTAQEDELRALCKDNLLHVIPSRAMLADAVRQWQLKEPGSRPTARAWHHDFKKYAAAQLNTRYRERFGEAMDDEAWAGWAAVKLVSDMVARERTADPARLLDALKTKLAFDGQKGTDLSFRETGQLRQPLLLVEHDEIVGEAPVRGVAPVQELDSLGLARCPK